MTRYDDPAFALYRIEKPDNDDAVSLDAVKKHCRVDDSDNDDALTAYRDAAIGHVEDMLGRALVDQSWEIRLSGFPCGELKIPMPPLIEVVSVKYIDEDGAEQTFDASKYHVTGIGDRGRISLADGQTWPSPLGVGYPEPVIVRFRAGYVDTGDSPPTPDVPAPIVAAVKLLVGTLYEHRETVVIGQTAIELPWAAKALLDPYRVYSH